MNKLAIKHLGSLGRMVNPSKGQYLYDNPKNLVVFNANVFIDGEKIWYGDLDLTLDLPKLFDLSAELDLQTSISVYTEMGGRFENETSPDRDQLVLDVTQGAYFLSSAYQEYYEYKNERFQKKSIKPSKKQKLESTEYNKSEFTPVLQLSDLNQFRATGKEDTECPYFKFYVPIAKELGVSTKQLQCSSIYVHPKIDKKLKVLTRSWFKKFHKLDGYKLQKELNWLWFDISPATFQASWAKEMLVYVKKNT